MSSLWTGVQAVGNIDSCLFSPRGRRRGHTCPFTQVPPDSPRPPGTAGRGDGNSQDPGGTAQPVPGTAAPIYRHEEALLSAGPTPCAVWGQTRGTGLSQGSRGQQCWGRSLLQEANCPEGVPWAHLAPVAEGSGALTWGSMLACSSGAAVSGGGMVMDRLGGFRLCRRLPDTEETLSPFLSAEAMVGRRAGCWKGDGEGDTGVSRTRGDVETQAPGQAARTENNLPEVGSTLTPDTSHRAETESGRVGFGKKVFFCGLAWLSG